MKVVQRIDHLSVSRAIESLLELRTSEDMKNNVCIKEIILDGY